MLGFLIGTGLFEPFVAGVLVPGLVGVLVAGVGLFEAGVGLEGVVRAGVVFDGAGLEDVVVGFACAFVLAGLAVAVLGLGLDKGVLADVVFDAGVGVFDTPFTEEA